jgi:uncharacterized protein YgbK (DUF1537 family)
MKVVVIADDFTGAAELAAAAEAMGYSAEVQTEFEPSSVAEVIAVDTDTRCLPSCDADRRVRAITADVMGAGPRWIYKKTDSVLRGNVRAEIEAILASAGYAGALFVPANPSKGRVIRDSVYYVGGVPLAETSFAADPVHPRRSSNVSELLSAGGSMPVAVSLDSPPAAFRGIVVPDTPDVEAVRRHAAACDDATLPAGGVEFFEAVLARRSGGRASPPAVEVGLPALFVCGSLAAWQRGRPLECGRCGVEVLEMPSALRRAQAPAPEAAEEWCRRVGRVVADVGCAMIAIGESFDRPSAASPAVLTDRLTDAVARVLGQQSVSTLCVEGGATAAALACRVGWTRFTALPAPDLAGVAVLRPVSAATLRVIVKPGSYPWPAQLWKQLGKEMV